MLIYSHPILYNEHLAVSSSGSLLFPLEDGLQHKGFCIKGSCNFCFPISYNHKRYSFLS